MPMIETTRETYKDGVLISTETVMVEDLRPGAAKRMLDNQVRRVVERCYIAGVPFPTEWQTYVAALRAIVQGNGQDLPDQPAYPAGT